jgi:hypothetical protein
MLDGESNWKGKNNRAFKEILPCFIFTSHAQEVSMLVLAMIPKNSEKHGIIQKH